MALRLFVYGTLRRGGAAHGLLGDARFLGEARTAPGFELLDCGEYPGIMRGGQGEVAGELYEVPEDRLPDLDEYEGCPGLFARELVDLAGGGQAEAYVMSGSEAARGLPRIACGDWMARALSPR